MTSNRIKRSPTCPSGPSIPRPLTLDTEDLYDNAWCNVLMIILSISQLVNSFPTKFFDLINWSGLRKLRIFGSLKNRRSCYFAPTYQKSGRGVPKKILIWGLLLLYKYPIAKTSTSRNCSLRLLVWHGKK